MRSPIIALLLIVLTSITARERIAGAEGLSEPGKTLRVVVFGGHPDDPESGAGGLIATMTRQGHEVICAYGTAYRSNRQFFGRPEGEVRREEATAACKVLGAKPKFFPYAHEALTADEPTLKAVSNWLDEVKPDIVVTHWPLDTHPNHHVVSSLVWRCYQRKGGWNLYFFEVMTDQQTLAFNPELYLEIGPVRDLKKRALDEHRSQGPDDIWKSHETMHRRRGSECGVAFAEAFRLVEAKQGCPLLPATFLSKTGERSAAAAVSEAVRDQNGVLVHTVRSPYQAEETTIRVLLPEKMSAGVRLPVVYVLPVEARNERRYGDGLLEVRRQSLQDRFPAIFVAPTFSDLPWYADHPTNPEIRQESYLLKVVVPFIERQYPARSEPGGRLLLGFSKSGWGAFSLLLRHPDLFGKAAAWDAPLMMDRPGKYGSGPIFGTTANFESYQLTNLLRSRAAELGSDARLIHLGSGNFRDEHDAFEALLIKLQVAHRYVDGPRREHRWESGWVPEALELLLRGR